MIPLWYNGLWAQASNAGLDQLAVGRAGRPQVAPSTWSGYWQMGGIRMLTR